MHRSYYLVRHGRAVYQEPDFRHADHALGTDWPLAERGHLQARSVTAALLRSGVQRVVSSGLRRARQTAEHIAAAGALPYEHAWRELNEVQPRSIRSGPLALLPEGPQWLHGWSMARAMRRHVQGLPPASAWDVAPIADRIRRTLARLDELPDSQVAVVGHGFWILLATVALQGPLRLRWIDNCSITRVDADGCGAYRVVCFARPEPAVLQV